jgi:hypothetical protein
MSLPARLPHRPRSGFAAHLPLPVILHFLVSMTLACNIPLANLVPQTPEPSTEQTQAVPVLPEAMVQFQVQLPVDTPEGEPVFLMVMDEVTGLALNATRHLMYADDALNYEVSVPFPLGSTIKYRYARQGTYLAEEHTSTKRPVRYRMVHVEGPVTVRDVVSTWSDREFSFRAGRIMGKATDSESGSPIPNLLVTAGGQQTITTSDGSFLIEGLPPGTHNLVAYALDGTFRTFQQGATVAAESTTPTPIELTPAPLVNVVFNVEVPENTLPAVPIRIAGSLYQFGNTFADLAGGMNTLAARMPALLPMPDGRYRLEIQLPAGTSLDYKYTLGDGFWNAETTGGQFRLRRLIIPEGPVEVNDRVESWGIPGTGPIVFDLMVPETTPATDFVSIQFNPYGWTEPIPMWSLGQNHWVYILYGPLPFQEKLGYRYCRNDQCGSADDVQTPGNDSFGRVLDIIGGQQTVQDRVEAWFWWPDGESRPPPVTTDVRPRGQDFRAGVEIQAAFHPSWNARMPVALHEIQSLGANWIFFSPSWTYTHQAPPLVEPVTGRNPFWTDLAEDIQRARLLNLNVALFPSPQFSLPIEQWWAGAPRDFAWWIVWFESYRKFALHHADLAQAQGAQALILGGDWILPALPEGSLADGTPSGVPADAETRWRELLAEVKVHFRGEVVWALPFSPEMAGVPPFIDEFDWIYLLFSPPLSDRADTTEPDLHARAAAYLDEQMKSFQESVGKPIVLGVSYPSVDAGATGCLADPLATAEGECLDLNLLSRPYADIATLSLDLEEQAHAYSALLVAINERDWINGIISRGYYPPAGLKDKSTSVHGKPASDVIAYWYPRLLSSQP